MGIAALSTLINTLSLLTIDSNKRLNILQLLAELDCLNISNLYSTVGVSILGHYVLDSVNAIKSVVCFMEQNILFSKPNITILNEMAGAAISASQRIFFVRNHKEQLR